MTFHKLRARVRTAEFELFQASAELDKAKARHRQALVSGVDPDRADLERVNAAIMECRDKLDIARLELEAEINDALKKAANNHITKLNTRVSKILNLHPLEETA